MAIFSSGREKHLIIRALVTSSISLKQQELFRQPLSDIAEIDALIDKLVSDGELERYVDGACWSLGLDEYRVRRRPPPSEPER